MSSEARLSCSAAPDLSLLFMGSNGITQILRRHYAASTRHAGKLALRRDGRAIDPASLQGVADFKAFRLVREGSDAEAPEGAEIADIDLLDLRLSAGDGLVLRDLLPQRLGFVFRTAGGELQREAATGGGRRRGRLRLRFGFGAAVEQARPTAAAFAAARGRRGLLRLGGRRPARARRGGRGRRRRRLRWRCAPAAPERAQAAARVRMRSRSPSRTSA